ncbi:non-canonical purine NTP pyrophosphatase [Pararhodospirillum oryzae]|uniref:Non-canonical purine NTP pyrophosphatase n=1 Tax=Pararhodospirillum oryzae TaxID=478448 RepID=A0A512H500_9PROT|nr:non-canonical purine NTP pyrophosphatase [Pararhodospirillum oryzae]GEO80460.1 non-canonical purine NTP pyrophosphatase [Pararhodospirillum oryzae]
MRPPTVYYATSSRFKRDEIELLQGAKLDQSGGDETPLIRDVCDFQFADVSTDEPLEISLEKMVDHKVRSAYRQLLTPCIVEHAGLILEDESAFGFPGGLTQPMWDSLSDRGFLKRVGRGGERAVAQAVVGYCDGVKVWTFVGETKGSLANEPKGERKFYWDTIFCPDEFGGKTYAEVCGEEDGLLRKLTVSQSAKALRKFVEHLRRHGSGNLFANVP